MLYECSFNRGSPTPRDWGLALSTTTILYCSFLYIWRHTSHSAPPSREGTRTGMPSVSNSVLNFQYRGRYFKNVNTGISRYRGFFTKYTHIPLTKVGNLMSKQQYNDNVYLWAWLSFGTTVILILLTTCERKCSLTLFAL
jgi:hypothetical protein